MLCTQINMKILKTQKLFYGKWAYKVSIRFRGAHLVRFYGTDILIRRFENPSDNFHYHGFKPGELEELERCTRLVHELQGVKNIKYRYEANMINIFTDTTEMYDKLRTMFFSNIKEVWEPTDISEVEYLKDNINNVIVDFLPHKKYRYKVTLKYSTPHHVKDALVKWIDGNTPTVKTSKSTMRFLFSTSYIQSPFIYVEDSKTLLFLQLIAGDQIKKTEKFILRSDINNTK